MTNIEALIAGLAFGYFVAPAAAYTIGKLMRPAFHSRPPGRSL